MGSIAKPKCCRCKEDGETHLAWSPNVGVVCDIGWFCKLHFLEYQHSGVTWTEIDQFMQSIGVPAWQTRMLLHGVIGRAVS